VNATDQASQQADVKPTIVLVHGAFADAFAADLPEKTTALMAATQRPVARRRVQRRVRTARLEEAAVLGGGRQRRQGRGRRRRPVACPAGGADIVEVDGSHVIMISQPRTVTDHILKAARAVAGSHGRRR